MRSQAPKRTLKREGMAFGLRVLWIAALAFNPPAGLAQGVQQPSTRPGTQKAPVTITAVGNKLFISSEDPEALRLALEMAHLMTQERSTKGPFEVIHLKNASAAEAAKTLDETFNGPKQTQQPIPFFNRGRSAPRKPAVAPRENRIRVVPDPASNSLLIEASPLDLLEVRRILKDSIDSGDTDSAAIMKTWPPVLCKYANATEVVNVLRDVFRESMNQNASVTSLNGFAGFSFAAFRARRRQNLDVNGNAKQVALSIGVDDRTNSLVLNCSEAMCQDVKKVVERLDAAARDSTRTVRVISLKSIDPSLVQQAIDALQGRRTTSTTGYGVGGVRTPGFQSGRSRP
jgi:type II secretory pathway component GspD/PulD (secretin)